MRNTLVSLFPSESVAREGESGLRWLDRQRDIKLHGSVVVGRDARGVTTIVEPGGGWAATLVGIAAGAAIGMVGGVVAALVGAFLGAIGGLFLDICQCRIGGELVDAVAVRLQPGMTAVLADIEESRPAPVDACLASLGAVMLRREPGELLDGALDRDVEMASAELAVIG